MMQLDKDSKQLWEECQRYLPDEDRVPFDEERSFCLQEKDLRDGLERKGKENIWKHWKRFARQVIYAEKSRKYSSNGFTNQKKEEYARRAADWCGTLKDIISSGGIQERSKLINVGSNDGEEVAQIPYEVLCVEISRELCSIGKGNFPHLEFICASADSLPIQNSSFDVYLSLRTWCVAGILADEALEEARRIIIRPNGLIVTSFPLRFFKKGDSLDGAIDDKVKQVASWVYSLFTERLHDVKTSFSPEDFFIYGKV